MSEARKCDRCHGYFELSAEDQKNRDYPYYMKGAYVKIMLFDRYGEREDSTRWFDLCPNCIEMLDKWLENPDNYDPHDLIKNVDEEYQKASEGIKTYVDYKDPCKSCHNLLAFLFIFIFVSIGGFAEWLADKIKDMLGW